MVLLRSSRGRFSGPLRHVLTASLGLFVLAGAAGAQKAVLARPGAGGQVEIVSLDEHTLQGEVVLSGLQFQPLQLAGFARRDMLRSDIPVSRDSGGVAPHVRLPEQGSLYLLACDQRTVLFRVDPLGQVQPLYQARRSADPEPIFEHVAVSPDGQRMLLATRATVGGDVVLVDTTGGTPPRVLTAKLPPLDVAAESLRLSGDDAWFLAGNRLFHAGLAGQAAAKPVDLALPAGHTLLPETALAADGRTLALVVQQPGGRNILTVDDALAVTRVTNAVKDYDTPSYASPEGPLLALSTDGSAIAWRNTVLTKELFVRRVQADEPAQQVSRDGNFTDTLDNVGILGFVDKTKLVFAVGETSNDPQTVIGGADFFVVDTAFGPEAPPQNLTQTSGVPAPPYLEQGDLEIRQVFTDPRGERLIVHVDPNTGGDEGLYLLTPGPDPLFEPLLPDLALVPQLEPMGDHVLIISRPEAGPAKLQMHLLSPLGEPDPLTLLTSSTSSQVHFDRFSTYRRGHRGAFVATVGTTGSQVYAIDLLQRQIQVVWAPLASVSPELAFTSLGRLMVGLGEGGPFTWVGFHPSQAPMLYPLPASQGFPLEN